MSPIAEPKLPALPPALPPDQKQKPAKTEPEPGPGQVKTEEEDAPMAGSSGKEEGEEGKEEDAKQDEEQRLRERQRAEIERLHRLGIPVPGVAIRVDKLVATVWLEDLAIECPNKLLADRVRAVVERAVEVTAPLWG